MSKKFLRKNEIRKDLNPDHANKFGAMHDAVITAKKGHKLKANTKTHSEYVGGIKTLDLEPYSKKTKHSRISPPFWQSEKQFGPKIGKAPRQLRAKIKNYNKKFY